MHGGHDTNQIFEMILEANGGASRVVNATPFHGRQQSEWSLPEEGQLAVDIGETRDEIAIVSTMAGADTTKIEVYIHNDLVTIRGERERPPSLTSVREMFHEECFWGRFSRTIVLPVEVKPERAFAEYTNGILILRIPKYRSDTKIPVVIVES